MKHIEPYMAFRFCFYLPEKRLWIGAMSIHTDPFTGNLWITRAHARKEPSLADNFIETTRGDFFMFIKGTIEGPARRIKASWTGMDWAPIDAHAANGSVALERIILKNVSYGPVEDLEPEDLPDIAGALYE